MSSAYYPQTDGQLERTIQTLEDLLRTCVLDHLGVWDDVLSLVEFTYNNSFQSSIDMAPFKALYGRKCRTPLCWFKDGETVLTGPELVQQTTEKVRLIQERLKAAQSRQKSYADHRRRPLEFAVGDNVFLRLNRTTGVGRVVRPKKLSPKFIGPYQVLRHIGPVAYEIALPPQLANLHLVFHVSQLRKYVPDPSHVLEIEDIQVREDRSVEMQLVNIVEGITKTLRGKSIRLVKVVWDKRTGDSTWERDEVMKELYPHLFSNLTHSLAHPPSLPRSPSFPSSSRSDSLPPSPSLAFLLRHSLSPSLPRSVTLSVPRSLAPSLSQSLAPSPSLPRPRSVAPSPSLPRPRSLAPRSRDLAPSLSLPLLRHSCFP
ncbi:uncharacterized protein LOC108327410 [Vigna angularis]|uniref:uncharacterized protein LOC108327410 n=1 Tax=Phaseolus angularis TaxID=3914 RepID=UPI000809D592|nr:uncharacterized protein LOC108327410 [Vigna angularis]